MPWLEELKEMVEKAPIILLRFGGEEWKRLQESRRGVGEFTIARPHALFEAAKPPILCLICGEDHEESQLYLGVITSRAAVTTLESRIKVRRGLLIRPASTEELIHLVEQGRFRSILVERLGEATPVMPLSPKLSRHLVERLGSIPSNRGPMRSIADSLASQKFFRGNAEVQSDALRIALRAFGLTPDDPASELELIDGRPTGLSRVHIMEDSVIEHDARHIPGYELVKSDLTGRALFVRGSEQLEVFTANRRPLEHVFGIDLIYLNLTHRNCVMLQYKMLEAPPSASQFAADWIYRPDANLDREIQRMKRFATAHPPEPYEYRLNPDVFYLKFVKRDASIHNAGIMMPIEHFDMVRADPACKGPREGLLVSFKGLSGRYLRETPFLDLIRSGYIGAHVETTAHLTSLVEEVLGGGSAVVAAIQSARADGDTVGSPEIVLV